MSAPPAFTVADLARRLNARLVGEAPETRITGLAAIDQAAAGDLTFIGDAIYARQWAASVAAAAIVCDGLKVPADRRPMLLVKDVDQAMIALLELFLPPDDLPDPGVHASASVHASAKLGRDVRIGAHVSVGPDVMIADGVTLHPGVRLYAGASIGDASVLHGNTVVRERCVIGRRVIIHQNASIGADGFGYRPAPDGRGLRKMPHIGNVVIEDDVEIGANTCIDRGKFGSTVIGAGTKIDNLCQIAHNVRIGRMCVIAATTGMSGSVTIGDGCQIGGQVAIAPHVTVGSGAKVAACSGIISDIPANAAVAGAPAVDARAAFREIAAVRRLPEILKELAHMRKSTAAGSGESAQESER